MSKQTPDLFDLVQLNKNQLVQFRKLIDLFGRVFEEHVERTDDNYLETLLAKPDFLALVVMHKGQVIGGLTGYELQKYLRPEKEFFVYDIAIDPAFQQRGLGTRLIARLKEICGQKGITQFFVDAHQSDDHALKFYESITAVKDPVVQFSFN